MSAAVSKGSMGPCFVGGFEWCYGGFCDSDLEGDTRDHRIYFGGGASDRPEGGRYSWADTAAQNPKGNRQTPPTRKASSL